jgi:hypothetical protein
VAYISAFILVFVVRFVIQDQQDNDKIPKGDPLSHGITQTHYVGL